ncbi:DUF397 domain-containing protein [Streptomyces phaeoluteigriseus]|uniref:DUF397 domain-containing protein n=1 Tax=Streptomyces phaeoluteigriseus TaxID=114686 RepID=A0ABY4ZF93_9ACTN|nr:DUF397 domain-containing protein [Streptomyces phaeoluteigriseus]USQ86952.1 DUF397 domain-containing protein [Streptomyces phaeoluteigriseus]
MTALPRNVPSSTDPPGLPDPPGLRWLRSSYSTGANNCVETARPDLGPWAGLLAVRDSKDPARPALLFSPDSWTDFTAAFR